MEAPLSARMTDRSSAKTFMNDDYKLFACELCDHDEFAEIEELRLYTNGQQVHVCKNCGFVQVIRRRSPERIAAAWANELYETEYTARIPAVKARHVYVAETMDTMIGLRGRSVADIGAGEGYFLRMLRDDYGASVFGIEPSSRNCALMQDASLQCFDGTAEQFVAASSDYRRFDIVTVIWTLENSNSCRRLMDVAWSLLKDDGHVVVATGSRILVPFKKPLDYYMGPYPADTHAFRFSVNTLEGLLSISGFQKTYVNHYIDSDVLCMIARKMERKASANWERDDWQRVLEFFARWHHDTAFYKTS
jgi:2-polyprenyl-3-methyl-5-hydroxy-6-metoxy-1,4-benzoquinol methylase